MTLALLFYRGGSPQGSPAQIVASAAVTSDPPPPKRWPADVYQNLAELIPPTPRVRAALISPLLPPRRWPGDVWPNLAAFIPSPAAQHDFGALPKRVWPESAQSPYTPYLPIPTLARYDIAGLPKKALPDPGLAPSSVYLDIIAAVPPPPIPYDSPALPRKAWPETFILPNGIYLAPASQVQPQARAAIFTPLLPSRFWIDPQFPASSIYLPTPIAPAGPVPAGKHRKRYGVRDGWKLLVFDSRSEAQRARLAIAARDKPARKATQIRVTPIPHQVIELPALQILAAERGKAMVYQRALDASRYAQLIDLYRALRRQEEEEIATILLLMHC